MSEVTLTYGKYNTLSGEVRLLDGSVPHNLKNQLIKYYALQLPVCIRMDNGFYDIGRISCLPTTSVIIDITYQNPHACFVRHMLYRAVDYNIVAMGLSDITSDNLDNFKITRLVISNYSKWF